MENINVQEDGTKLQNDPRMPEVVQYETRSRGKRNGEEENKENKRKEAIIEETMM